MYVTPSRCPVCTETLTVTRLQCPACGTAIEGHFQFSRLERLSAEQLGFVELFISCEGKLNWVAQEMQVSYPTVRSRLDDVIRGMGFELRSAPPGEERQRSADLRQAILDDLAAGKLDSAEAIRKLRGIRGGGEVGESPP